MTTDMIRHHLNDALLLAYSAASLPEAFNLVVAAHVSLCDTCRARLEAFDALGGALLETAEAAEDDLQTGHDSLTSASLADTMRKIAAVAGAAVPVRPRPAVVDPVLPTPIADYVQGGINAVQWRPVGGGVRQSILPTSDKATVRLLHIPAGMAVPDHGHRGLELTLVLQGAFADAHDRFARGDIEIADETIHHTPIAEPGPDCICLAATDAPLKFSGLLPRLAQPFFRI